MEAERVKHWLSKGARPTVRVSRILGEVNILPMPKPGNNPLKAIPKKERKKEAPKQEPKKEAHKQEVKKQFNQDPNWVEPYYIERFYEIIDEHRAKKAGYQVNLVAQALDDFYSNYDNTAIPLLEAVRIVSLAQDGETEKADLCLLKPQKRYKP